MIKNKLSTFLGLRERVEKTFQNGIEELFQKFKNKQGLFKGERKTYTPIEGYADEPTKRSWKSVASTVKEQYNWLVTHSKDYLEVVFAIEKTNSLNIAKADLIVNGNNWGTYSTLELLRLKSLLDGKLKSIISEAVIRNEDTTWKLSNDEAFVGRNIFETPVESGFSKTTLKETYIVFDPHIKEGQVNNRPPVTAEKTTQVNIGEYTSQSFSGELSIRERAELLVKYEKLYQGVISALETANNIDITPSDLGTKSIEFLFT